MFRKAFSLFLCLVLLLVGLQTAQARRYGSPYARAKVKGHMFLHRPYYRQYKGPRSSNRLFYFPHRTKKAKTTPHRVGRTTL